MVADSVRLRDAAAHGLTRSMLRGRRWERVSSGLYAPARPDRSLLDQARAVSQVLPRDSGFGHLTSAALRGWWLPNRLPPHVLLATTTSRVHVQRPGLYVRRSDAAEFEELEHLGGIRCVTAAQTLLELARDLTLVDLVPMVDAALAGGLRPEELREVSRRRGVRGVTVLRKAVKLADGRSESWWESVLRLLHVVAGLGPVRSQVEIFDEGLFVARADLHLVGTRRYPECDGGEHRDRDRHQSDLMRDKAMARLGLERYGYTTSDITYRPDVIVFDAEQARGLPHDSGRVHAWWTVARPSTLTGGGRARLGRRLEAYRNAADR